MRVEKQTPNPSFSCRIQIYKFAALIKTSNWKKKDGSWDEPTQRGREIYSFKLTCVMKLWGN